MVSKQDTQALVAGDGINGGHNHELGLDSTRLFWLIRD